MLLLLMPGGAWCMAAICADARKCAAPQVELLRQSGFDHAFNYKTTSTAEALAVAAPDGLDIYFEVSPTSAGLRAQRGSHAART